MQKKLVVITIPLYKETINDIELISLTQCIKTLFSYKIVFFAPEALDTAFYEGFCNGKIDFSIERFENKYFQNIDGYNQLMLSTQFYKRFIDYKFILVYQLDAYVFKDELIYWCSKDYDFIGAPHLPYANSNGQMNFLKGYSKFLKLTKNLLGINHTIKNVGNGGFSLRKTRSFYLLLKLLKNKIDNPGLNEDSFFEYWGNLFYPFFKLPTDDTALQFSIETSVQESLKKLNNNLPFGCHAFEKYDWETWKPYILS